MIDNATIQLFSGLIVYTVLRAIKLDKLLPWFSPEDNQAQQPQPKQDKRQ